ncbi:MAG TPA: MarR family transcriptional regulator [Candidatus Baltobacteraceae bacterium]|nr:MarR family transcriptional regulator [Candidatus Baltobacteraceae bacterium]
MLTENVAIALGVARIDAWLRKRVESVLPGIGFTDFVILNELASVVGGRLRPVDLANRLQLTASGVTRAVLPLAKIGLVERAAHERDARASYVAITQAGRERLEEALDDVDRVVGETLASTITRTDRIALLGLFERLGY